MLMPVPKSLENAPAQVLTQLRYCEIIFVRYFVDSINPNGNFFQRFIAQICQIYFIRSYDLKINCFWFQDHKLFKNNWTSKVEIEKILQRYYLKWIFHSMKSFNKILLSLSKMWKDMRPTSEQALPFDYLHGKDIPLKVRFSQTFSGNPSARERLKTLKQ